MNNKYRFLLTSLVFITLEILFMFFDSSKTFNWPDVLIGYAIFALIYFVVSKIYTTLKT